MRPGGVLFDGMLSVLVIFTLFINGNAQFCHPSNMQGLMVDGLNDDHPSFVLFGITAGCTIFLIPQNFISDSNFIEEVLRIDKNDTNECYGASPQIIIENDTSIEFGVYFMHQKLLATVHCEWNYNGLLYYCIPKEVIKNKYYQTHWRKNCGDLFSDKGVLKSACKSSNGYSEMIDSNDNVQLETMEILHVGWDGIYTVLGSSRNGTYKLYLKTEISNDSLSEELPIEIKAQGGPLTVSHALIGDDHESALVLIVSRRKLLNVMHIYQLRREVNKWAIMDEPICIGKHDESLYINIQIHSEVYYLNFVEELKNLTTKTSHKSSRKAVIYEQHRDQLDAESNAIAIDELLDNGKLSHIHKCVIFVIGPFIILVVLLLLRCLFQ